MSDIPHLWVADCPNCIGGRFFQSCFLSRFRFRSDRWFAMATFHTRSAARFMIAPSVVLLFAWMIVPLAMTIYFSLLNYNLLNPGMESFVGLLNYQYFLTD